MSVIFRVSLALVHKWGRGRADGRSEELNPLDRVARLLVVTPDALADRVVTDLAGLLRPGDRLVLNNTRVIPARLSGVRRRVTGQGVAQARIERHTPLSDKRAVSVLCDHQNQPAGRPACRPSGEHGDSRN